MKIPNAIDGIPFEVRPIRGDPAEAQRRAIASMNATKASRPLTRRTAQPAMTLGGRRYLEAELRWQAFLRRRRRRIVADSYRAGDDQLDLARARATRARLRRIPDRRSGRQDLDFAEAVRARLTKREAYVHGSHPTPLGKYTQAEVDRLGREGKALAKGDGSHWFPIALYSDIHNAVAAYRALKPKERNGVHAWIVERARMIGAEHLLPKGMGEPNPGLHPNELERERGS